MCEITDSANILEDIGKRCRTCLRVCLKLNALSENITICNNNITLTDLIVRCASVQISELDGFPQKICESCQDTAVRSHLFRLQCENSENYLQSISQKLRPPRKPTKEIKEEIYKEIEDIGSRCEETIKVKVEENEGVKHTCDNCNGSFATKRCLIKHMKIHYQYQCKTCGQNFKTPKEQSEHEHQQHQANTNDAEDLKKRTCGQCGKVFQYRASMLKHQRKHSAPPNTCSYCSFKPSSTGTLSKHMEQMHAHLKNIICNLCGKAFFREANLRLHMLVHTGVKKHICEICGVSFALGGNLAAHRRLHTGEKPYTCSHCGRGFTQQSALRSHEAGHSDRRDHVCAECGAAFSRAGALRNHRKRHSAAKPFECSMCNKRFTFSSERKRHLTIHSGDKNHICEVCGRRFNRGTNLKVHRRIHTGETPHVCVICGKGFIQAHCLRTHMKTHLTNTALT